MPSRSTMIRLPIPRESSSFPIAQPAAPAPFITRVMSSIFLFATPTQQQKLVDIAKEHDLIVTGGSDFHGLYNETMTHIGSMTTDKENLDKLFKLIHINSQKANKAVVKAEK